MTRAGVDWIKVTATGSLLQGARAEVLNELRYLSQAGLGGAARYGRPRSMGPDCSGSPTTAV